VSTNLHPSSCVDYRRLCSLLFFSCILLGLAGCGSSSANDAPQPLLATPGTVGTTAHPLVAQYSVTVPNAAQVTVEFGTTTSYGRITSSQTVPAGGGTVQILVAGMRAQTTYHMRARADIGGETFVDQDHTFTTGALPTATFPAITVTPPGLAKSGGVDLISAQGTGVTAVVYDTDGSVVWYYYDASLASGSAAFPIRELDNGDFLINFESDVREVDLAGRIVRQVTFPALNAALTAAGYSLQVNSIHHDLLGLSNGHWILLVNEHRDFQDLPGYPGTTTVLGDALVDLDTNNQPVWVWRAFDHMDVNRHPYMFPDWTHGNGLVYEPDGGLLLSMRHQSWILKIDYANGAGSGDILWRLGPEGDFTLSTTDPAQWFYNQHFPNLLQVSGSTQQIALYDNGDTRPDSTGQPCSQDCYSRAVIMNIDEAALTARIAWQYLPGWYSFWGGSVVVLPNGDVEFDSSAVNGGGSSVVEVPNGSAPHVVWQMNSSHGPLYRAYRIPSLYPGVSW
jgi:arylsulfate sulfotransferase